LSTFFIDTIETKRNEVADEALADESDEVLTNRVANEIPALPCFVKSTCHKVYDCVKYNGEKLQF